jgi:hypothetical protein
MMLKVGMIQTLPKVIGLKYGSMNSKSSWSYLDLKWIKKNRCFGVEDMEYVRNPDHFQDPVTAQLMLTVTTKVYAELLPHFWKMPAYVPSFHFLRGMIQMGKGIYPSPKKLDVV